MQSVNPVAPTEVPLANAESFNAHRILTITKVLRLTTQQSSCLYNFIDSRVTVGDIDAWELSAELFLLPIGSDGDVQDFGVRSGARLESRSLQRRLLGGWVCHGRVARLLEDIGSHCVKPQG